MEDLSPKVRRFVAEYVKDPQNQAQAAVLAGYSKRSAAQIASRLIKKDNVAAAIKEAQARVAEKSELTQERIQRAVLAVLEFDPREAFNDDGTLKPISELPTSVALAIAGIDVDDAAGEVKKIRFSDRIRAAELGSKLLGLLREKHDLSGTIRHEGMPESNVKIDFSGLSLDELRGLARMRAAHANGSGQPVS